MGVPFEKEEIFPNQIACGNSCFGVAELEVDQLVEVAAVAVVVDPRLGMRDGCFGRVEGLERLVVYPDQICGCGRGFLARRRDRRNGIADEPDLVEAERMLVLGDGQNAEWDRQILADEDGLHSVQPLRRGDIDRDDACVWLGAAEKFAVQHAWEGEIVGEPRRARHFRDGVDFAQRLADNGMLDGWNVGRRITFQLSNVYEWPYNDSRVGCATSPRIRAAASSTAS